MAYFPLFVDLEQADVLIVGGGETALRKMKVLLEFGAVVTVVSPSFTGDFAAAQTIQESFSPSLLDEKEYKMVIAATNSLMVNHDVCLAAKKRNIPVNSVDDRENCSFFFPAVIKKDDVVVGISSGGKSPLVAQHVKTLVSRVLPGNIGTVNEEMGKARKSIRKKIPGKTEEDQKRRAEFLGKKLRELL